MGLRKALLAGAFLFWAPITLAANAASETSQIRHVIDGDTLVRAGGKHVRLIGINAPEPGKDGAPDQPLATQARQRLAALVQQRRVTLVFEQQRQDHYGRQLAHVLLPDGTDAGEILLREGLAWAVAVPPNLDDLPASLAAENEARLARRGVWQLPAYAAKPADQLSAADTGFGFIEGKILRHKRAKHVIYFDLAPRVALLVSQKDWKKYYHGQPSELVGRKVIARGWLTQSRGRLRMRVPHPAMLTWHD